MMNWMNILATNTNGDDSGWIKIVGMVVFVMIGIIVNLIKKAGERSKQQSQQPPRPPAERQQPPEAIGGQQAQTMHQDQPETIHRHPAQTMRQEHPQPMPSRPRQRMTPPPAPPRPAPVQARPARPPEVRAPKIPQLKQRSLKTLEELHAAAQLKSAAKPRQLEAADESARPKIVIRLGGPNDVRTAIIYSEIISPPKALRQSPEMWDV